MDFVAVVDQVIALLRQRGRVAYRTLKRQFQLDDEALEDLKIELIDGQRVATAEFLYETNLFPERAYTFKHALTHEVAYGGLLRERQRLLHGRIVAAIEQRYADRLADQVERLAHHALRGEVWNKAIAYCCQAGDKAVVRSAHREAVACFEQALVALAQLPEGRERNEQAIDIRFGLRNALVPRLELSRVLTYLQEAEGLAQALGNQAGAGGSVMTMRGGIWGAV
jgi:predicted ATPase